MDLKELITVQQKADAREDDADWWYLEGLKDGMEGEQLWDEWRKDEADLQEMYEMGYADSNGDPCA